MISTLSTADGLPLHVHAWPTAAPGHGTVLIVQGKARGYPEKK